MHESGGYTVRHGSVQNADQFIDKNPTENHKFLEMRARLVEAKQSNPSMRIAAGSTIFGTAKEEVKVNDTRRTGLSGPRVKFMKIDRYRELYGEPKPEDIKSVSFGGSKMEGVDIIDQKDSGFMNLNLNLKVKSETD